MSLLSYRRNVEKLSAVEITIVKEFVILVHVVRAHWQRLDPVHVERLCMCYHVHKRHPPVEIPVVARLNVGLTPVHEAVIVTSAVV